MTQHDIQANDTEAARVTDTTGVSEATRVLTPEAQRALAEAAARRAEREAAEAAASKARPKELGGPSGPEPVRYGDWEKGGIAWDF
jgi:hypothetical protein